MNYEYTIKISDESKLQGIKYIEGSATDLADLIKYVECAEQFTELIDWYRLFKYLYKKVMEMRGGIPERITINAFTIELLSAGRCISEGLDVFSKIFLSEADYQSFHSKFISEVYDTSFCYRFCSFLRDYSQHGHFPVSCTDDNICFNILQIKNVQHFNMKRKIDEDCENLSRLIGEKAKDIPKLAYFPIIVEYACIITRMVYNYLTSFQELVSSQMVFLRRIMEEDPLLINHGIKEVEGLLFFVVTESPNNLHAVDTRSDGEEKLKEALAEVELDLKEMEQKLNEERSQMTPL